MADKTAGESSSRESAGIAVEVVTDDPPAWQEAQQALGRDAILEIHAGFYEGSPLAAAALLINALDALHQSPDYFCGDDFGGTIALAVAALFPARLRGLVLVGTSPEPYEPDDGETDSDVDGIVAVTSPRRRSSGFMDRLESITTPALIVVGEADAPFYQRGAELLHGWMPFSRLVRIPNAAHRPHVENPAAIGVEVAAFLHEMEASRRAPG